MVDEQTDDRAEDHRTREHPAEAHEVATGEGRVGVSIGHPLRSLSGVSETK
jgi:hypothetical protein